MIDFNKIVNKLLRKGGKILFKEDIFDIIDPERKPEYQNKLDKIIYRLRSTGIIISLKSGVYIIPTLEDKNLNKIDLLEKYYLKLLKKYIIYYTGSDYYISGKKSLEIHLKNFEVPQKIYIISKNINKKILVGEYEIIFKTISGKNILGKKINLYQLFSRYVNKKFLEDIEFKVSNLELSLLETAVISDGEVGLELGLINKALKKYKGVFDVDVFYDVAQYKYIMSCNRLKELSRHIDPKLQETFLDIIKKNGNLFIGEGLRGF